jgi:hypothetical protein
MKTETLRVVLVECSGIRDPGAATVYLSSSDEPWRVEDDTARSITCSDGVGGRGRVVERPFRGPAIVTQCWNREEAAQIAAERVRNLTGG